MPSTLSIEEGTPAFYPRVVMQDDPSVLVSPAILEPRIRRICAAAWQRVESWIAYRWNVRPCTFVVEGPGEWVPPLRPFTPTTIKIWLDSAWVTTTVGASPLGGYVLDSEGPFQFVGTLGDTNEPPRAVKEAVFRLVEYYRGIDDVPAHERPLGRFRTNKQAGGASAPPNTDQGVVEGTNSNARQLLAEVEREQVPGWTARAMQLSGAADLLRPWRNLGAR